MQVSPLDESGNAVDWWFIYKVPKLSKSGATASATGYEYVYYDTKVGKIAQSPHVLTDGKGALDLTLNAVFKNTPATTGWILYNDEMPADAHKPNDNNLGHSKGVIAFDTATNTAFWLLHSWPQYADPGATLLPTPMYGQTYLCMSIDLSVAGQLAAEMLTFQEPQSYLPRIPASLSKSDPLYALTQPIDLKAAGTNTVLNVKTRGGLPFKVIAKSRLWNQDFWSDLVGPTLKADMDDETWIRGPIPPVLDSDHVHKTVDLKYIDLRPLGAPWVWPETHDHAKWGITTKVDWVCVGDINRMISQEKRGGGAIALQDQTLWSALSKTDFIKPPPGMTVAQAKEAIRATQSDPRVAATAQRKAGGRGHG